MAVRRPIEIDLDVHKALEARRRTFNESPNDILRAILELGPATEAGKNPGPTRQSIAWRKNGVELPEGTYWRLTNSTKDKSGMVADGYFHHGDAKFRTPSRLAMELYRTKAGKKTNINGWRYIEVKRPQDAEWMFLLELLRGVRKTN